MNKTTISEIFPTFFPLNSFHTLNHCKKLRYNIFYPSVNFLRGFKSKRPRKKTEEKKKKIQILFTLMAVYAPRNMQKHLLILAHVIIIPFKHLLKSKSSDSGRHVNFSKFVLCFEVCSTRVIVA